MTGIKKTASIFFSPAGSTKKAADIVLKEIGAEVLDIDLCTYINEEIILEGCDLALIAVPSFGGRVPKTAMDRLAKIKAEGIPCALLVTYGNREYDDTISELILAAKLSGFKVIGAAAAVCRHSVITEIAQGRPDEKDIAVLKEFAIKIKEKTETENTETDLSALEKDKALFKEFKGVPLKPKATRACVKCMLCAKKCPVAAIDKADPKKTDKDACISCMRCVNICPKGARKVPALVLGAAGKMLKKACSERKETVYFI